jgi:hypothetical protein
MTLFRRKKTTGLVPVVQAQLKYNMLRRGMQINNGGDRWHGRWSGPKRLQQPVTIMQRLPSLPYTCIRAFTEQITLETISIDKVEAVSSYFTGKYGLKILC